MAKHSGGTLTTAAEVIACYKCGLEFAVSGGWYRARVKQRDTFWCPNGHPQAFLGEGEEAKLRRQVEALRQERDLARAEADRERGRKQTVARRAAAQKGQVTRLKRRLAAGACPVCQHTLPDLAAHMAAEHPGYSQPEAEEVGRG